MDQRVAFDYLRFFDSRQIEYVTSGPNVSGGNVAIHCPYCGADDPSQHLSVSKEGAGWRCLRRPYEHKGKSPVRLVRALLGCSHEEALRIAGLNPTAIPSDFAGKIEQLFSRPEPQQLLVELLPEFREFGKGKPSCRPFIRYMRDRGFDDVILRAQVYGLRYAALGEWRGRIIFPITFEKQLVTWTGRTIYRDQALRYKVLTHVPEKQRPGDPLAFGPVSDYLLWYDECMSVDADTICICEGPFDALKVEALGFRDGVCATCFFTSSPSPRQVDLLHELLPKFRRRFLLLDQGTLPQAISIAGQLSSLGVEIKQLPKNIKDPGDLDSLDFLWQPS